MISKGAKRTQLSVVKPQLHLYNAVTVYICMGWAAGLGVLNGRGDYPECVEN